MPAHLRNARAQQRRKQPKEMKEFAGKWTQISSCALVSCCCALFKINYAQFFSISCLYRGYPRISCGFMWGSEGKPKGELPIWGVKPGPANPCGGLAGAAGAGGLFGGSGGAAFLCVRLCVSFRIPRIEMVVFLFGLALKTTRKGCSQKKIEQQSRIYINIYIYYIYIIYIKALV